MIFRMNEKADREAKIAIQRDLERIMDKYNLRNMTRRLARPRPMWQAICPRALGPRK
jgi:hypothetical protein